MFVCASLMSGIQSVCLFRKITTYSCPIWWSCCMNTKQNMACRTYHVFAWRWTARPETPSGSDPRRFRRAGSHRHFNGQQLAVIISAIKQLLPLWNPVQLQHQRTLAKSLEGSPLAFAPSFSSAALALGYGKIKWWVSSSQGGSLWPTSLQCWKSWGLLRMTIDWSTLIGSQTCGRKNTYSLETSIGFLLI